MFQMKTVLPAFAVLAASGAFSADIHLAGDSTCATYKESQQPLTGWGQMLPNHCKSGVRVINRANPGRSTKSYREGGDWDKLLADVKPGDFVVIQFAHNNRARKDPRRYTTMEQYKADVIRFVREVKDKKAYSVLATPIEERVFKKGEFRGGHQLKEFSRLMKEAAKEENVPVIDLEEATWNWLVAAGENGSRGFYMSGSGIEKSKRDNTHLTRSGAIQVAEMFVISAQRQKLPIAECFNNIQKQE